MDVAVVINMHARRGSEQVVRRCREGLPGARILASRSLDESADFARSLTSAPPALLVSAGGDGTAVGLFNALRTITPSTFGLEASSGDPMVLGVLPLGTGNALANATGAPGWGAAIRRLAALSADGALLPRRRFQLVEVEDTIAPFAGTGWDSEIIDDFHHQKTGFGLLPAARRNGLMGYMNGIFTRTLPRNLFRQPVEVTLINTGEHAMGIDARGEPYKLPGGEKGAVLYRGPSSVLGASTTEALGFKFRAFPFATSVPGRFNMVIYGGSAFEATVRMRSIWLGKHPLPKMNTWMLTACRTEFSRPVPFQLGGDRLGLREAVDFRLAEERVDLLDWSALRN